MTDMSDRQLHTTVGEELTFEPSLDAAKIAVEVQNGIVTLTGSVPNFEGRQVAERAVKRLSGVTGVIENLTVNPFSEVHHADMDIAAAARRTLDWHVEIPQHSVRSSVERGWMTLEGQVEWAFQRQSAHDAVAALLGVTGVTNKVTLKPHATPEDVQTEIQAAFRRRSDVDANHVDVQVDGSTVTLSGQVRDWGEIDAAVSAALNAAGVTSVDNQLFVRR